MLLSLIQIVGGLGLLVYGADRFVDGASQIARKLGVAPLVIGLSIVGVATSFPEVLVGAVAALGGKTQIAIGNALGSNIANIGLVLGGTAALIPLETHSRTLRREYWIMCVAMVVALIMLADLYLGRVDAVILLLCLAGIIVWMTRMGRSSSVSDPLAQEYAQEYKAEPGGGRSITWSCILFLFGLAMLLGGAEILVRGAVWLAESFGISDLVIGLTIIAVGTSLPELAASLMSVVKKEPDIAIGNIIGSNIFNMLMVLGVPPLIHPESFGSEVLLRDFTVMAVLTVIMGITVFLRGHGRFDRGEGLLLLSAFLGYQAWLFFSATS